MGKIGNNNNKKSAQQINNNYNNKSRKIEAAKKYNCNKYGSTLQFIKSKTKGDRLHLFYLLNSPSTNKQTNKQANKQTNTQTNKQTNMQTFHFDSFLKYSHIYHSAFNAGFIAIIAISLTNDATESCRISS